VEGKWADPVAAVAIAITAAKPPDRTPPYGWDPVTISRTVDETNTMFGVARAATRAAMWTAIPAISVPRTSVSPA
jgi:hypothetical protein